MFGALILAIICGTWAGAVATRKGRSMQWWFIIGFFLPVIGVICIYIAPKKAPVAKAEAKS
jgi:predicted MFS family arabinose efflux permease